MTKLKTPDLTVAQLAAVVGAALGVLVAAGLPISDELQSQIINLVTILATALVGGDAVIRNGRSRIQAAREAPPPTATATVTTGTGTASTSGSSGTNVSAGFAPLSDAPTVKKKATRKPTKKSPKGKP